MLTTYRDTQRVRDSVRLGTDPNPPVLAWGTHLHRCEPRVRAMPVGRARWGTCGDLSSGAPVNQSAAKVASYQRQWLPDPNAFANSEKREQSAFPIPSGHVSVRKTVLLGVRSKRYCELWESLVNRSALVGAFATRSCHFGASHVAWTISVLASPTPIRAEETSRSGAKTALSSHGRVFG